MTRAAVILVMSATTATVEVWSQERGRFDHPRHRALFPSCVSCHAGAARSGEALWPAAAACAACHDGTIETRVSWSPTAEPRRSNLRFTHAAHGTVTRVACTVCHTEAGAPRMAVQPAVVQRCLDCHAVRTAHLAAPDTACATCHVPLAEATRLTRTEVAAFPAPPSHAAPRFSTREGHGAAARAAAARGGGSCATCHAREFCYQCHAGAAPPPAIAALGADSRSTAIGANRLPISHGANFADRHGPAAASGATRCAGCHVRTDCLDCHRPATAAAPGYHPEGFLTRHPAAAYSRETSCSDCHNVGAFCTACHTASGLVTERGGVLGSGFHDAKQFFQVGHGQAARQSLESCVACHTERDCLSCHSALGGRRFNPHGPGFDAERMRRKNFEMCTVCHGAAVPSR
jgi:hypothetical protein